MKVLVINAGSSSLKYQLINMDDKSVMAKGLCERIGQEGSLLKFTPNGGEKVEIKEYMPDHTKAIRMVLDALCNKEYGVIENLNEITAVGHRVVHGGEVFSKSVRITDEVKEQVKKCFDLAPLHNPANIIGIEACEEAIGKDIPQVGVFDTAFHQTMPDYAYMYGIPYNYYEEHKIRRYGFHGTSHRYVTERAAAMLGKDKKDIKIVTCHLGNGSSLTAVDGGNSVDTTMGLTPLAGLMMGTRSGDIDPAIITFVMDKYNMTAEEVLNVLNKKSGVEGVSGVGSDFRDLDNASKAGNKRAQLAVDMFAYQVKKYIGAYAAAMGGVDAVVFTAGVGENDSVVRAKSVAGLEFMGIKIDAEKNKVRGEECDISAEGATVKTLVIPTNEELMIAMDTVSVLEG